MFGYIHRSEGQVDIQNRQDSKWSIRSGGTVFAKNLDHLDPFWSYNNKLKIESLDLEMKIKDICDSTECRRPIVSFRHICDVSKFSRFGTIENECIFDRLTLKIKNKDTENLAIIRRP